LVLRLRIRIQYGEKYVEGLGIANSGFAGKEPELTLPHEFIKELLGENPKVVLVEKTLADGNKVLFPKIIEPINVYVITDERIKGPIKAYCYITRGKFILLNDALLSALNIVIIDPFEGIWCFRDEIGKKERRSL